jgi:hypothetical protein
VRTETQRDAGEGLTGLDAMQRNIGFVRKIKQEKDRTWKVF